MAINVDRLGGTDYLCWQLYDDWALVKGHSINQFWLVTIWLVTIVLGIVHVHMYI